MRGRTLEHRDAAPTSPSHTDMNLIIILTCFIYVTSANNSTNQTSIKNENKSGNSTHELLKASETGDRTNVEIVKQIKRINDDGSYTVGYEADDGTFKIESRDVLGNVKGTFGYIDKDGEIKRVTYSSSSDSTPVPVTTITTPTTPTAKPVIKVNKTVSSTTRRTNPTIVYPTRSSFTTRGTVVQPIPRRRLTNTHRTTNHYDATTETKQESTTSNILNLYKHKPEESVIKRKTTSSTTRDDLVTKSTTILDSTTKFSTTVKPVYENVNEKTTESKSNTIRRELTGTSPNPHMIKLQQSVGDDSTDVYGGHLSMGTVRPLFTTTTPRQRLVPFQSIVAAHQKLQQQYQNLDDQETTIEASTGRVFDHENVVTSNPVPVIHIPQHRERVDENIYQQPLYRRPHSNVVFRTQEYLRDNPGAPIPIGNTRQILYQNQIDPQFVKESTQQAKGTIPEAATVSPHDPRTVTRIIPIPVDERGIPLNAYQARFINTYRPQTQQPPPPVLVQPRLIQPTDDMNSITTPVSTRDLKRLLQILIIRQNRLQALMDQLIGPGPPYQPLPIVHQPQYDYRSPPRYQPAPRYQDEERYDYRYDQERQNEVMYNQYDNYESQRYVPRRKLYTRPVYDADGSSSNRVEEAPEYLPADVREALLLKMLMLAISPDFLPAPPQVTEMTTSAPTRKQVRNVQILGEEGSMEMKHPKH